MTSCISRSEIAPGEDPMADSATRTKGRKAEIAGFRSEPAILRRPLPASQAKAIRRTPYLQGQIDGMCGFYGIINAFQCLFPATFNDDDAWELMVKLCEVIAPKFPGVIWKGAGYEDTVALFKAAQDYTQETRHLGGRLRVTRPFARRKMERVQDFWAEIAAFLEERGADIGRRVAFIGIGHPDNHWTVVTRVGKKSVTFFDSWELKRLALRQFTISGDVAKQNGGMHKLDTRQTFLLERLPPSRSSGRADTR